MIIEQLLVLYHFIPVKKLSGRYKSKITISVVDTCYDMPLKNMLIQAESP